MPPATISPVPQAPRLSFARLGEADAPALAAVLSDPEVTRSIMAKATTPQQCLDCARARIAWHNSSWDTLGYGVWALRRKTGRDAADEPIIGWCGLTATAHGPVPELLYGLTRAHWGGGLATEAAGATIAWTFANTGCERIDAVVFGPLNPGSAAVVGKLGMRLVHRMPFATFLPDLALGRDVLDYELWRLRDGDCIDVPALLFQAPYKAGLLVSAGVAEADATLSGLVSAATGRAELGGLASAEVAARVAESFGRGLSGGEVDVYHLSRSDWEAARASG